MLKQNFFKYSSSDYEWNHSKLLLEKRLSNLSKKKIYQINLCNIHQNSNTGLLNDGQITILVSPMSIRY